MDTTDRPAPAPATTDAPVGTIYLIHFAQPYQHARHYIGWTQNLEERIDAHRHGRGARLLEVVQDAGIHWTLAQTWSGTRADERRLKNRHGAGRFCPYCKQLARRAKERATADDPERDPC